ncbi:unnamed protein product [Sphagnum troendelagicum]|uniref:AB hydrolase-1 domain-containing protein n=1 Tax=Sphagnum troendelagicum TaxID=128251 RepID=A0ABP0USN8_9BRYO
MTMAAMKKSNGRRRKQHELRVSEDLLKEMGVRLVSIDRPGYSLSDFNQKQTYKSAAGGIAQIADALELGEKFWLLGYSGGGPYCWAAARFIPERLAGIAMWAPVGNYGWKDISKTERKDVMRQIKPGSRRWIRLVKMVPQCMLYAYIHYILVPVMGNNWVELLLKVLSPPDVSNLNLQVSRDLIERDSIEPAKQKGKGVAHDWLLLTHDWGFELSEMLQVYQGPLHIFHGDLHWVVPLFFQQCINKLLPGLMHLHILNGEGHYSAFHFNDRTHCITLDSLFGNAEVNTD